METKEQELDVILKDLLAFKSEFVESSKRIIEAGDCQLIALDFMAMAVNNRSISMSNGFVLLAKDNNYLAAVALIRLQLDNALRFFASTLVKDSSDFATYFLSGKNISSYSDISGQKMSDNYLARNLEKHFKGVLKLYKDSCSYIHLSDKHFFPTIDKSVPKGNRTISIQVGTYNCFTIDQKIDFATTMFEVSKLVVIVVEQWKFEKDKITKNIKNLPING